MERVIVRNSQIDEAVITFANAGMGAGYEGDATLVVGATMNDQVTAVLHFCSSVASQQGVKMPTDGIAHCLRYGSEEDQTRIRDAIRSRGHSCIFIALHAQVRVDEQGILLCDVQVLRTVPAWPEHEGVACTVNGKPLSGMILAEFVQPSVGSDTQVGQPCLV